MDYWEKRGRGESRGRWVAKKKKKKVEEREGKQKGGQEKATE